MDTIASDAASPPSSCATSGGTPATLCQSASPDDFLLDQRPCDLVCPVSSEHSTTAPSKDIEQQCFTFNPSSCSSLPSPSSSTIQHQNTSFAPSQQNSSNTCHYTNIESPVASPEQSPAKSRGRMRELSAPLPSVPPSTPASAVSHRSSFSQTQPQNPSLSPSCLRRGSPVFSSPLTELSDAEGVEQDIADLSDSNSIEIISGYVAQPFVPCRYRSMGNDSQNISQSSRSSCSIAPSSSSPSSEANAETNVTNQRMIDLSSSSQTLTTLSQSSSAVHTINEEARVVLDNPSISSHSKPATPSSALSRPQAMQEDCLLSKTSFPVSLPMVEPLSHQPQCTAESDHAHEVCDIPRTPNVYINGLPPHFPDESLYLMTRDFGHVLSVRTFTRCVGEKMSGYGFVLFDSIDSAERCIETLRKYRNLHPSFSKAHKIPGTPYATGTITLPPAGSLPSLTSQSTLATMSSLASVPSTLTPSYPSKSFPSPVKKHGHRNDASVSTASGSDFSTKDITFREKMERLKDDKSTNLYMEGLPLTIDDVSLGALVSPHKIASSRFFQTKLSNPPRMIAFVRLDSRAGAEEIIERLHGRVVRGWNDNGCRISVRFADTHEQRELRRAERLNKGEEEVFSDTQLSMAHAALLNLRGAEAQTQMGNSKLPQQHLMHQDHRLPVAIANAQFPDMSRSISTFGGEDASFHFSGAPDAHLEYGGHSIVKHDALQYRHKPPPHRHSNVLSSGVPTADMNLFDQHAGLPDFPPVLKQDVPANTYQPRNSVLANTFNASRTELLQQQSQLQQLQLLRHMQQGTGDPNSAIGYNRLDQTYSLMPSADITAGQFSISGTHGSIEQIAVRGGQHRRQNPVLHATHPTRSHGKGNGSGGSQSLSPESESYLGCRDGDQVTVHQRKSHQQHVANQSTIAPEFGYDTQFIDHGTEHQEGIMTTLRRTIREDGEVTLISPALTYASRTPSTLSPATPLFNTLGTPAAAPATVPRGKINIRDREYARIYKHELRQ